MPNKKARNSLRAFYRRAFPPRFNVTKDEHRPEAAQTTLAISLKSKRGERANSFSWLP